MDIQGYARDGSNLVINLADGRVVVLEGYYSAAGAPVSRLFISADGYINEVTLSEGGDGPVYAQYGPTEYWAKWSPDEELIFLGGNDITAPAEDDEVSMLGAALLGGGGLLGLGGVGAAGVAAAVVAGGGDSGGGGRGRIEPKVNEDGTIAIGGDQESPKITITGDAEPGSEVDVSIGDKTVTTEADQDGKWQVDFEGETFPEDGEHDVVVVVKEPDGTETTLEGPVVVIDTTPPEVVIEDGVVSTDDIVNAEDYEDGIEITGSGEPGAEIAVVLEGITETTVIGEDGQWQVVFDPADIPGGEREVEVVITATDGFGNSTVVTDVVAIDTVPHPIAIHSGEVGGDGVVNLVEEAAGVAITGTSTPGATVTVTVEGVSRDVVVGEDGTWTAEFEPGTLPGGQYETEVTATTVDAAGNASSTSGTFRVDTEVRDFGMTGTPGGADGVINAAEQGDGFTMSGTVEPGSTVR
ncbi:MAG: Ig-like domain-containing protein, partial [Roseovarius sp.]|uniref:Ig-like domain-containing protein n=1 Tax=Roseovarius sp. TaxID=1486281 RepID=UPI004059481A